MEKATKVELRDGIIMKTIGLLLKQTELVIYFVMYLDIIKHDDQNKMTVSYLITNDEKQH